MAENPKKYFLDISESIDHIEQFTTETPTFFDYEKNLLVRRAVERELGIIGEAINKLLQMDEGVEIEHARRIVDLRNRVIHGYDKVDDAVIWGILVRHLPKLKVEIEDLLRAS
jgi:uncharacterized protein with HEPN domain